MTSRSTIVTSAPSRAAWVAAVLPAGPPPTITKRMATDPRLGGGAPPAVPTVRVGEPHRSRCHRAQLGRVRAAAGHRVRRPGKLLGAGLCAAVLWSDRAGDQPVRPARARVRMLVLAWCGPEPAVVDCARRAGRGLVGGPAPHHRVES